MRATDFDVLIVGGGPAGLAAAVYAGRNRLKTVVLEKATYGGQVSTTWDVENYPGFELVTGPDLCEKFEAHARKFGAELKTADVLSLRREADGALIAVTADGEVSGRALLLATGAEYSHLGVPGEAEFRGKGVSYCATCDGAFFRGKEVAVVGGGNTALDEGLFLTRFASKVTLVHRRAELRGDQVSQEHFKANPKTAMLLDTVVEEIAGGAAGVERLKLRNKKTGAPSELAVQGVFVFVGTTPITNAARGFLELDRFGAVVADRSGATSQPGVFAAGDCVADAPRQIATAVGDGVRAALAIKGYLEKLA